MRPSYRHKRAACTEREGKRDRGGEERKKERYADAGCEESDDFVSLGLPDSKSLGTFP